MFMLLCHVSLLSKLVDMQCAEHVTALERGIWFVISRFGCSAARDKHTVRKEFNDNMSDIKIHYLVLLCSQNIGPSCQNINIFLTLPQRQRRKSVSSSSSC